MPNMLFANNANTTLASGITSSATSISVTSATNFPSPTGVQYFYCTLADAATQTTIEIVKVTSVTGTTFAITRAQDGTSATAFDAGAVVSLRLVRASLNDFPKLDETNTFNADQAITGQLTTSAGMATTGQFTATAPSNGVVTDLISGYGRFSTFSSNGFQWFTGGIGTTKIMQLSSSGVITTSTWNGATVGVAYGGTGVTSATGTGAGASVVLSQAPAINSPVITAYSTSTVPLKVYGLSGQITELFDVYTYNGGTLAFQINSSGAIATGTWNGSVIGAAYGGTGEAGTLTGILYGNGTSAHTVATTAQLLSGIGTLPVANGGTGLTTLTAGYIPYGNGTSAFNSSSNLFFDSTNTRLGIGTSSPWSQVSISTPSGGTLGYYGVKDSVYGGDVRFGKVSGVNNDGMVGVWSNNNFTFYTNSTEVGRFDSSGNLLVGTTTASGIGFTITAGTGAGTTWVNNWSVDGGTHASFRTAGVQKGYIATSSGITIFSTTSDIRAKENIEPSQSSLKSILNTEIVSFDFKDGSGHSNYGGIAQWLLKTIPEAVFTPTNSEDMMAVDWSKAVPRLIKAFQEQQEIIEQLKEKVGL